MLLPGLFLYSSQHSCAISVKLFLYSQFQCPFDASITKIKNRKGAGLDERLRKLGNSKTYCSDTAMPCITRRQYTERQRAASTHFLRKGIMELLRTNTAAKIYNSLLINHIQPEIEKVLWIESKWFSKKSIHNISNFDAE